MGIIFFIFFYYYYFIIIFLFIYFFLYRQIIQVDFEHTLKLFMNLSNFAILNTHSVITGLKLRPGY